MDNKDMPAMPNTNPETYPTPCPINYGHGLTKREHFAGLAMQGFAACDVPPSTLDDVAKCSVAWADALLDELDKAK
jgi:hypothetical protein